LAPPSPEHQAETKADGTDVSMPEGGKEPERKRSEDAGRKERDVSMPEGEEESDAPSDDSFVTRTKRDPGVWAPTPSGGGYYSRQNPS